MSTDGFTRLDVVVRIYDKSASRKDVEVTAKLELWEDRRLDPVSPSPHPLESPNLMAFPSPTNGAHSSSSLRSPSPSSFLSLSRRPSLWSLASSTSSGSTLASRSTHTSSHTSPISSTGERSPVRLNKTTEPMLVFFVRRDGDGGSKCSLLGIKCK